MAKFSDLPELILTEILVRLPVKPLLLFKSVCKPWLHTISDPNFIKYHIRRTIMANTQTLLTIQDPFENNTFVPLFLFSDYEQILNPLDEEAEPIYDTSEFSPEQKRQNQLLSDAYHDVEGRRDLSTLPIHFNRINFPGGRITHSNVVGSCNGVLCLYESYLNVVHLWNPSIMKWKKLPDSGSGPAKIPWHNSLQYLLFDGAVGYDYDDYPYMIGFGYDYICDDYKVVRIVYKHHYKLPKVQVYSANADSWREFHHPIRINREKEFPTNVGECVKGILYFDSGVELVCFDLHTEVLGFVPYPCSVLMRRSNVLDFEGCAAMFFDYIGDGTGIDLWTMDGVSGPWVKKFSIEDDLDTKMWFSLYLGGGLFFGNKLFNGKVFLYNALYDYVKNKTIFYDFRGTNIRAYVKYTETFVSLEGFEQVETKRN